MSASIAQQCSIFVDGYDLTCAFKEVNFKKSANELDTTALCTTGDKTFLPGLKDGIMSLDGMYAYDGTNLDEIENILNTAFENKANLIVSASLGLLTIGDIALLCRGGQTKKDVTSVLDQLVMTNADIRAAGNIFRGAWLHNAAVNNTTATGSSVDNGALTSDGGILHFHCHTPGVGLTDASIVIEHSANNSTWATLISSQALGAARGALAVEVASGTTVNRYLRAKPTTTGGQGTCVAAFYRR